MPVYQSIAIIANKEKTPIKSMDYSWQAEQLFGIIGRINMMNRAGAACACWVGVVGV